MELQDHLRQIQARDASIVAISADPLDDATRMAERLALGYHVAVDPELGAIEAYGVRMEGQDIAVPSTFILDRRGAVVYRRVGENITDRPEIELVLKVLSTL